MDYKKEEHGDIIYIQQKLTLMQQIKQLFSSEVHTYPEGFLVKKEENEKLEQRTESYPEIQEKGSKQKGKGKKKDS